MKLFLASEAKNPVTIKQIDSFVGGLSHKSIAYIPTAANANGWESWKGGGSWNLINSLNSNIKLIQLEDYRDESVIEDLKDKDIIWMAGGYSGYLLYWLRRTKLNLNIKDILNNGTIYVGSSAGSMVTCLDQDVSEWYFGEEEPGASVIPGLDLVGFNIWPHFEDLQLEKIKLRYKGKKMYLLKNGESITVENEIVKVIGEERIVQNN